MKTPYPYPGLRPFQMDEADIFFGRGEQINQMLHKLETHRFLAVIGASGSGKSSLVRAGLLPALRDGFLSEADGAWRFVVARPGDAPFRNLAHALHRSDPERPVPTPEEIALTAAALTESDRELIEAVRDLGIPEDTHVLVLIDQFEEIFRYRRAVGQTCLSAELNAHVPQQTEMSVPRGTGMSALRGDAKSLYAMRDTATAFVNQLLATARQTERTIYVVLTMRSDFLGDCDAFLGLPEAINDGQFLVPRLTRAQMRATIVEPAKAFGAALEPGLIESLLNDTGSDPDQLPLLQHTLLRLWLMRASDDALSLASYRQPRIGRLHASLSNHADEAFHSLTEFQQRIAEKMFRNLCNLDDEGKWTRRWIKLDEIAALVGIGRERWPEIVPIVAAFIDEDRNFLIATPDGPFSADTTIDISHEALIRQWGRMQAWLQNEQDSIQQYRRLLDTARRWRAGQAGLWGNPDLDVVLKWRDAEQPTPQWAQRCGGDFELAQEFLQNCIAVRKQQQEEAEERRQAREREIAAQKELLEALQRKESERVELQKTRRGRAALMLAERAELWHAKPETRHLPSWWEWLNILLFARGMQRTQPQQQMMRAANRHRLVWLAISAVVLLLVAWSSYELNGRFQARALHDRLVDADIEQVPAILDSMASYRRWLDAPLRQDFEGTRGPNDSHKHLHVSLALLRDDPTLAEDVLQQLLDAQEYEVTVIRDELAPHKAVLIAKLWPLAAESASAKHRLAAAAALASFDPDNPRWKDVGPRIADDLLATPAVFLDYWMKALRPVRGKLQAPLEAIYRDATRRETERSLATAVLADYASDQPETLARLLLDADQTQFIGLFPSFQTHGERALTVMERELDHPIDATQPSEVRARLARRHANAAIVLLRCNRPAKAWPLLKHSADPTARSYLIHLISPLSVRLNALWNQYLEDADASSRRAIILALGEPGPSFQPALSSNFVQLIQSAYAADDPGIHAAAEWLLRRWGYGPWLMEKQATAAADKKKRDSRLKQISGQLANGATKPQWYVNGQAQTMVVLPGPIDFVMGSPRTETERVTSGRVEVETQHRVRIGRTFAISATHVTVEQYGRYAKDYDKDHMVSKNVAPTEDCPAHNINWARAANYCEWLSAQENIPKDQWCFEWTKDGRPKLKANYLSLTGYRLPTEAEYEYACRAHAMTSRYFGEARDLLGSYAWYLSNAQLRSWPVGILKPNDFGLFDMHGNMFAWCMDRVNMHGLTSTVNDIEDLVLDVKLTTERAMRGGSFVQVGSTLRCASGDFNFPATTRLTIGLRVARTIR